MSKKNHLDLLFGDIPCVGRRTFMTAAVALSIAGAASAQHTIGIKLGMNGNGDLQNTAVGALLPTDIAGAPGYAQANWNVLGRYGNNSTNSFGTNAYAIFDSNGDDSHVTIHWDATGNWSVQGSGTPSDQADPNKNLMNAYSDSNGNGNANLTNSLPNGLYGQAANNKPMVYISGLQAWLATEGASAYDVVIYVDGDNQAGRTGEYWIQQAYGPTTNIVFDPASPATGTVGVDLTTHVFIRDFNNFTANPTYQQVPLAANLGFGGNNGRAAAAGNYAVFSSLTNDSWVLRTSEFNSRCGINNIQIIPRTTPGGPLVSTLPASQTVLGARAIFRAVVAGVVPFAYQWQTNGVNLVNGGNVSGATSASLTISNVGPGDVASYSVIVSNAGGFTTSSLAPLTLITPAPGSYAEKIVTNGAYAYWRLNDLGDPSTNNSPAYDYLGGFNGVYGGSAQNGFNGITGPQPADFPGFEANNSALRTVGSSTTPIQYPSSYVNWMVAPPLGLNTNTVTLCAWINPAPVVQLGSSSLIFTRGNDVNGFGYGANNNLGYTWNNAGNTFGFVSGLVPPSNVWSFVALTISPTNAIIYLYNTNGQLSATNSVTHASVAWAGPTFIGDDPSSTGTPQNRAFTGSIDEVAVFNKILADQDLYLLFKKGLNVGIIPAGLSSQPLSQALYVGRTANFSVTASGDKPLNYQWRSNGVNMVTGGRVFGANNSVLTITNVTLTDSATYDVVVNNVAHLPLTSSGATLTVLPLPSPMTAYETALQGLNPRYYWRMNEPGSSVSAYDYWGGNIATNDNANSGQVGPQPPDFPGFETTNAANHYDGLTMATATGLQGVNNNLAQFSIIGWFNADGTVGLRSGLFGQNDVTEFGFHGAGTDGFAQLGIWTPNGGAAYLNQSLITPGQWYFAAAVGDGSSVNLYLFTTNSAGGFVVNQSTTLTTTTNYGSSAFPFNIGGDGVMDATGNYFPGLIDEVALFRRALSVAELSTLFAAGIGASALAPQVTAQPGSQTLYAGRTATFAVSVVGSSPLTYLWRTNGVPLPNGGNVSGATSATLTITNLIAANATPSLDVVITNSAGSVTSSVVALNVIVPTPNGYEAAIIALNPLAYYRLNETSGTTAFDFWGSHAGAYQSAAVMGVAGPQNPPFFGFEPANTAVGVSITPSSWVTAPFGSLSINTVTMCMWINPSGATLDPYAGLLVNRNSGVAGGFGYTGGQIGYTWNNNNANTYNFRSGFVPPAGQWSFVALVVTPTNATIYYGISNILQSAVNTLAHTSDVFGNNWQIGRDNNANLNDGTRNFDGYIDEVAVFTTALTPAQLQLLYSTGQNGAPVTLSIRPSGTNVIISWPQGTLLQASGPSGPWTTNSAASPYTNAPIGLKYYKVIVR